MTLILGRKTGMTQLFADDGTVTGVTVVSVGPCVVMQIRSRDRDGYDAVQLGFEDAPDARVAQPQRKAFAKAGVAPKRFLREERLKAPATAEVGSTVTAEVFSVGDIVDVVGTTKGRGFSGTIRRHNFNRGPKTHGCMNYRAPGSIGSIRIGKVPPGKRMAGHYGAERHTSKNLVVMRIDAERGLLFLRGAVPGPNGGFVQVRTARTGIKKAPKPVPAPKGAAKAGAKA
jgi:large subunit ribosomal protein L3